ncbi:hypothetical protein AGATL06_06140 [Agathobaculum sp. TL06]
MPDFVTMHSFPHEFRDLKMNFDRMMTENDVSASFALSKNENYMMDAVHSLKQVLAALNIKNVPIIIDEWNSTIWQRDLCADTCYRSAYIIKNMLESMGQTNGKGYWTVSDYLSEWNAGNDIFHGGQGIFTYNGIPKSAYYAFSFLNRMSDELLAAEQGWYATKTQDGIQILFYHYCHYSVVYKLPSRSGNLYERYHAFKNTAPVEYHISVTGLKNTQYICRYFRIGPNGGSAFDEWLAMGAPKELTAEELRYLKSKSIPTRQIVKHNELDDITVLVQPLEVVQLIISACDE